MRRCGSLTWSLLRAGRLCRRDCRARVWVLVRETVRNAVNLRVPVKNVLVLVLAVVPLVRPSNPSKALSTRVFEARATLLRFRGMIIPAVAYRALRLVAV